LPPPCSSVPETPEVPVAVEVEDFTGVAGEAVVVPAPPAAAMFGARLEEWEVLSTPWDLSRLVTPVEAIGEVVSLVVTPEVVVESLVGATEPDVTAFTLVVASLCWW